MKTESHEVGESKARGVPYLWVVYEDYAITEGVLRTRGEGKRRYAPIVHKELPTEIARITPGDEKAILQFARRYGHLGYQTMSGAGSYPWCGGDPLGWIWVHAQTINLCLRITKFLQGASDDYGQAWPDTQALKQYLRPSALPDRLAYRGTVAELNLGSVTGNVVDLARYMRRRIISENIAEVRRTLDDIDGQDRTVFTFFALVEMAYWHLANAVDGGDVKQCPCGAIFIQTDRRQRYCPPRLGSKESACATRQRVKKYRIH